MELMGGLSNFDGVANFFSKNGYMVVLPELPLYSLALLKTNVKSFSNYLNDFIEYKGYKDVILIGNSLGGHIGLYYTKLFPTQVKRTYSYRKFWTLRKCNGWRIHQA